MVIILAWHKPKGLLIMKIVSLKYLFTIIQYCLSCEQLSARCEILNEYRHCYFHFDWFASFMFSKLVYSRKFVETTKQQHTLESAVFIPKMNALF